MIKKFVRLDSNSHPNKRLLVQVDEPKYRTLSMLAVFSGARQRELLGLRWGDMDWDNCQLAIQRTFNNGRLFTPKTQTSKRKIDLGPTIMKELKKWRLACPKNDLDLVFPNEAGNHINNKNMLRRNFRPALEGRGLPLHQVSRSPPYLCQPVNCPRGKY